MEAFIEKYAYIAMAIIMVIEFLIGASKLKSNSTIELVINIIKFLFKLEKKELELPKK